MKRYSLDQEEVVDILCDKFLNSNKMLRIFINGNWGVGKSYTWKLFEEKIKLMNDTQIKENKEPIKLIYLSVFGVDSLSDLSRKLKLQYLNFRLGTNVLDFMEKKTVKLVSDLITKKLFGDKVDFVSLVPDDLDKTFIICIDDIERISTKIEMQDLMGFIEKIGQKSNVLVIGDQSKIKDPDYELFSEYKEKVIDREYCITDAHEKAIQKIIKDNGMTEFKYLQQVLRLFKVYGKGNLRVLIKVLNFIAEFEAKLNNFYGNDSNERLLCEFLTAVIIEDSLGKGDIVDEVSLQKSIIRINEKNTNGTGEPTFYAKYQLPDLYHTIAEKIVEYIKYNKFDVDAFNNFLKPPVLTGINKLVNDLKNLYLFNDTKLKKTIDKAIIMIESKDLVNLSSPFIALVVISYLFHWNNIFELKLDLERISSNGAQVLNDFVQSGIVDYDPDSFQGSLDSLHYGIELPSQEHVQALSKELQRMLSERNKDKKIKYFKKCLESKDYFECRQLILSYSFIAKETEGLFDYLNDPECDYMYYSFLNEIKNLINDKEALRFLVSQINNLINTTTDKVVIYRLKQLIKGYESKIDMLVRNSQ